MQSNPADRNQPRITIQAVNHRVHNNTIVNSISERCPLCHGPLKITTIEYNLTEELCHCGYWARNRTGSLKDATRLFTRMGADKIIIMQTPTRFEVHHENR